MKLATLKDGSRDGQLVVVSRDLSHAHYATGIAHRMQQVLDDWGFISPQLQDLSTQLNHGRARHAFPFNPAQCMAPLPRAYQWADGSAYLNHVELVRKARNAEVPESFYTDPLMYQGGSGAMHIDGSKGKAWRARPVLRESYRSCSCGLMKPQSSSTCCSRLAMPVA